MLALFAALLLAQAANTASPARPASSDACEALAREAVAARDAGRLDEALAFYTKALKLRPQWDDGLWNAGSIAYDRDKYAAGRIPYVMTISASAIPAGEYEIKATTKQGDTSAQTQTQVRMQ
ncbi:MAG TPA: tetratricopeptide repeat protein [Bryobacteraceae bacterium]|nr:tetratricopeptide repeat protein [Bryobacteraceae bacterium]